MRVLVYGILGCFLELAWTGVAASFRYADPSLKGRVSLWMFPIYGLGLGPGFDIVAGTTLAWPVRGVLYALGVWGVELLVGLPTRNRLWDYADEHFSNEQLIREKYQGIRPAPGYPACPDHSLKPILFDMLGGSPGEVSLTENFAMLPTSAVSGFYFGHRDSQYFGVARIGQDQLQEYSQRRDVDIDVATRWLRPNLD